jgi:acetolactate synthase-1/2/3 large subunit
MNMEDKAVAHTPKTAAEALLLTMKARGVDYLFANAGTDFPPVVEALARGAREGLDMPEAVTVVHETAVVGMAHGYYLVTGRPQAAMVHVNVGLANSLMPLINAASDNVPLLMMAGRTPLTEAGRFGARSRPIHWGQEMRDQGGMLREVVKWDYELRHGDQVEALVERALAIAMSEPCGPVYLGLPREPLSEDWPADRPLRAADLHAASAPAPDAAAIEALAGWLAAAERPLIVCQRGDPASRLGPLLGGFAERHGIPVVEHWPLRNVLPSDHPMQSGFDPGALLKDADVVVVLDSMVPWTEATQRPAPGVKVAQIGPDPLFAKVPVRGFRADLAIAADPVAAVVALAGAMPAPSAAAEARRARIADANRARRKSVAEAAAKGGAVSPMTPAYVSRCVSEVLDDRAVVFTELGFDAAAMSVGAQNRLFSPPLSAGLGWGLPAALGAQLADRDRLVVAGVGDGSYMFANPVACHQVAEALNLPVLTIVFNNGVWNAVRRATLAMYPQGDAARANTMPLTALTPAPDFPAIAGASRGWGRRVEDPAALPAALAEAVRVVREEKRQALLEVRVAIVG